MALVGGAGAQSAEQAGQEVAAPTVMTGFAVASDELNDADLDDFFECLDALDAEAASDEAFEAGIEGCEALLPDDADFVFGTADVGEWDEIGFEDFEVPEVVVETEDGVEFLDFGDGDGTITITKTNGEISVAVSGDVTSEAMIWDELDFADGDVIAEGVVVAGAAVAEVAAD